MLQKLRNEIASMKYFLYGIILKIPTSHFNHWAPTNGLSIGQKKPFCSKPTGKKLETSSLYDFKPYS